MTAQGQGIVTHHLNPTGPDLCTKHLSGFTEPRKLCSHREQLLWPPSLTEALRSLSRLPEGP